MPSQCSKQIMGCGIFLKCFHALLIKFKHLSVPSKDVFIYSCAFTFYVDGCLYVCNTCMQAEARKRESSPLEQQTQIVVAMCMLRTEPRTSETPETSHPWCYLNVNPAELSLFRSTVHHILHSPECFSTPSLYHPKLMNLYVP